MAGVLLAWQIIIVIGELPLHPAQPVGGGSQSGARRRFSAQSRQRHDAGNLTGMVLGTMLGSGTALALGYSRRARRWLLPMLIASQAIPVFAIAPLLVLWLGYGMASKIAMTFADHLLSSNRQFL